MKLELHLARRYLFRGKAKHLSFIGIISCMGVALGVATLIIVMSVMNGFDRDLTQKLLRFNYHLTIESVEEEKLWELKSVISQWKDVESCSVFMQTQVFGKFDKYIVPLVVKGFDFSDVSERELFSKNLIRGGLKEKNNFLIGEELRRRFFVSEKLEFYPLQKKLEVREENLSGTFNVGLYDIDNSYIIADLEKVKSLGPNYLVFLGVKIRDPFVAKQMRERISEEFPEGVFVSVWMETNQALFSALELEKLTMFVILSLIVLVASFNIFATLTVKVVEKTKDIGILRALGFTSNRILAVFSFQGLILGVIGVFSGSLLGLGICFILEKYHFIKLPQEIYYIEYLPVAVNIPDTLVIIFLGIFLCFISSLFPAIKASRLSACEALRYE